MIGEMVLHKHIPVSPVGMVGKRDGQGPSSAPASFQSVPKNGNF